MRIAGVSMTYNDGYKLKEWISHYQNYKEQLEIFVIVDNGSDESYKKELKESFPEAIIIERATNGGCTAAYNDGIRYVLENTDIEAIAIIGNDIKTTPGCLPAMYNYLYSEKELGIVSAAILYKDSSIIDNYGHVVRGFKVTNCNIGEDISSLKELKKHTDLVSGGFTMAKREFYLNTGLQDEALFMYCDELDTMLKAKAHNYNMGVIGNEYVWHWHINQSTINKRSSASRYLISRNRVYLAKKNKLYFEVLRNTIVGLIKCPIAFYFRYFRERDAGYLTDAKYSIIGVFHGLIGEMYTNKYTKF